MSVLHDGREVDKALGSYPGCLYNISLKYQNTCCFQVLYIVEEAISDLRMKE